MGEDPAGVPVHARIEQRRDRPDEHAAERHAFEPEEREERAGHGEDEDRARDGGRSRARAFLAHAVAS
ncbi:hypothetical protein E8A74_16645 [Polyangium fumosum]|uniref:Uncharacterized protein n=1 Tax=Polyangium fumosum TaxID=889272 RepID=A0A4V5PMX4_9BACT|nr:hypothetical protein E8A74_16645 [Polyangium fumosum]